jgi:branched-chain amino acid aminotransferase
VVGGELRTPTTATGLLPGIVRELLLETVDVREVDAAYEVLHTADEVFLTSSLRGVQPVTAVDGHEIGGPGPLTLATARALAALATDD